MDLAVASYCFLHPPPPPPGVHRHSLLLSPCSSSHSSVFSLTSPRNSVNNKRKTKEVAMASYMHNNENSNSNDAVVVSTKRAILLMGISAIVPFLELRAVRALTYQRKRRAARAPDELGSEDSEIRTQKQKEKAEQAFQQETSVNQRSESSISAQEKIEKTEQTLQQDASPNQRSESEVRTQKQTEKPEQTLQREASPNPFLFLLNGLGICSTGVLSALYALAQKEKGATEAKIESMTNKLKEKQAAIVLLEKNFESKLVIEKEERNKQRNKANEEQQILMNQLKAANSTITGLGQELRDEKRLAEELNFLIDGLQTNLTNADKDDKELQQKLKEKLDLIEVLQKRIKLLSLEIKDKEENLGDLSSTLAAKESEFKNLTSIHEHVKDDVVGLNKEIKVMKDELLEKERELESKNVVVNDLNVQVSSLLVEKEDTDKKLDVIHREYSDFKLSSEKKTASDAKLVGEREHKLDQLKEQLEFALDEAHRNQVLVADLTQEKDDLRAKILNIEVKNVKNLEQELQITQETLEKSRNEASDLMKQLQQSRNLCSELEVEISKIRAEFADARETLQKTFDEAKRSSEVLAGDLASSKDILQKTKEELQVVSLELAAAAENRGSLQKELVAVYKKAENTARDLEEEKKMITSLNKELMVLETQNLKDKEARKSLATNLEEATKSLDAMNGNALNVLKDLELANSRISSLEDEKCVLYKSLAEQKQVSQEARENMADAHNLVMRLGKEREILEKRAMKLVDELASAKGEILRQRSRTNSPQLHVNDQHQRKSGGGTALSMKKNAGRRKVNPQQDNS